jgi:hypothetical protein
MTAHWHDGVAIFFMTMTMKLMLMLQMIMDDEYDEDDDPDFDNGDEGCDGDDMVMKMMILCRR